MKSVAGIIRDGDRFYLGKRKKGGSIGGKWEFPGGKVEGKESLEEALKREFLEELEVSICVKNFIGNVEFKSDEHSFTLYAYEIELNSYNVKYNEHTELKWFSLEDLKSMENLADSDKLLICKL